MTKLLFLSVRDLSTDSTHCLLRVFHFLLKMIRLLNSAPSLFSEVVAIVQTFQYTEIIDSYQSSLCSDCSLLMVGHTLSNIITFYD